MPDDHSDSVPPLPIPNRTVKRICADDSAATSVKVGHRQAFIKQNPHPLPGGGFCVLRRSFFGNTGKIFDCGCQIFIEAVRLSACQACL